MPAAVEVKWEIRAKSPSYSGATADRWATRPTPSRSAAPVPTATTPTRCGLDPETSPPPRSTRAHAPRARQRATGWADIAKVLGLGTPGPAVAVQVNNHQAAAAGSSPAADLAALLAPLASWRRAYPEAHEA